MVLVPANTIARTEFLHDFRFVLETGGDNVEGSRDVLHSERKCLFWRQFVSLCLRIIIDVIHWPHLHSATRGYIARPCWSYLPVPTESSSHCPPWPCKA